MLNAFSVDVEDYFHVSAFASRISSRQWPQMESRVVQSTHLILKMLDERQVRGTFFVLGWVADRYPQLVKDIAKSGHEIGCHSYWHKLVYEMTPDEFRDDLRRCKNTLEQTLSEAVVAYRAPSFSITQRSLWALKILIEEKIVYDSSVFPIYHDRYGIPDAPRFPYRITSEFGTLSEFPPSVARIAGVNLPVSGGGYFRLYPFRMSRFGLNRVNCKDRKPFVFYVHPWEVDPLQPSIACPLKSRVRHYVNLKSTERKLDRLLDSFRFGSVCDVLGHEQRGDQIANWDI